MMHKFPLSFLLVFSLTFSVSAEGLDGFEQSFSKTDKKPKAKQSYSGSSSFFDGDDDQSISEAFLEAFGMVVVVGLAAGGANAEAVADQREDGNPVLPVFQINAGYQWIDEDLTAIDYSLAAGHGLVAAGFRHTHFSENSDEESEDLDLMQAYLFYRMALHARVEWALGMGGAWLKGDASESGFSLASPLRVWPVDWVGFEIRPTWSFINEKTLSDIETSLLLRYKQVSLQAGYRWIEAEDSPASLSGWRTGLSWRF